MLHAAENLYHVFYCQIKRSPVIFWYNYYANMPKISIITAIHNGLAINKIFYQSLAKYTVNPFELIIIDNTSTDGSTEFFEENGATIIYNDVNYSYPHCQNQGIKAATGDYLFFLNNDLIVSPFWDLLLIQIANEHGIDFLSACGIENTGEYRTSKKLDRKWKRVKYPLLIFGPGVNNLILMFKLMYGNWERFCQRWFQKHKYDIVEGILGNNVMMTRYALSLIGFWDERIQKGDFDLFMQVKNLSKNNYKVKPCQIAKGVFIHHYVRMTSKYASTKPDPFADKAKLISLDDKWTTAESDDLHPDNSTIRKT
jgi:GT2 family glycosyltransferase